MMASLLADLRYCARVLLKNPGFTAVAIMTLAIGIGANTAIFSVVHAVLLRPLPYHEPDRLVMAWVANPGEGFDEDVSSYPNFVDWRTQNRVFSHLSAVAGTGANFTERAAPEEVGGAAVTGDFFGTFGVRPAHGRWLTESDTRPGNEHVVVLSHGLWQRRFGGDAALVGRRVRMSGRENTVVGVMPQGFAFPSDAEFWIPLAPTGNYQQAMQSRSSFWLHVVGRLKADVTVERAQAEMSTIMAHLTKAYPQNAGLGVKIEPLHDSIVGDVRPALLTVFAAVGLVLAIACANVANLLLARGASRQRELAVRSALGAGRWRLVRQLITESVLLSFVGGCAGLLLAFWGLDALRTHGPQDLPRLASLSMNAIVLAATVAVSVLTGIAFGVVPALQISRPFLSDALKEGGRTGGEGSRAQKLRNMLVVAEVAVALVLLVGAGLLLRSFHRLQSVDPGFDAQGVLTLRITLPRAKYAEPARLSSFFERFIEHVRALPGVSSAAAVSNLLLEPLPRSASLTVQGRPPASPGQRQVPVPYDSITGAYFDALKVPLTRGRLFTSADDGDAPQVAIVNAALVRRFFPNEDPIGRKVTYNGATAPDDQWMTIVGVVGDARRSGLDHAPEAELFMPHRQAPDRSMVILIRTDGDPAALLPAVRAELAQLDRDQPIAQIRSLRQLMGEQVAQRRFNTVLLALFGAIALALATIGLYGVIAYSISRRTHEIGVRMALGAHRRDVIRMVVRQALTLAGVGVAVGTLLALTATRVLAGLLFGVGTTDPLTFVFMSAILILTATLAGLVPARRAASVDPVVALRGE